MIFDYFQQHFQVFLNIFARVFGLLLVMPVFSTGIPTMVRAGLSFFIALLSTPLIVGINILPTIPNIAEYGISVFSSLLVGLSIGFVVQVTVSSLQLSSSIFSTTMGLSFSENVNPITQENIPTLGNFLSVMVMLLFIRTESHFIFIEIIVRSFQEIPIIHASAVQGLFISMKTATAIIFTLAFRISLPIIGITLLLDIAMGIIGRVAPQFNVMVMGWNIKIFIGFVILWFILPGILDFATVLFKELHDSILRFIQIAKQGA
ncbi:MAG: flagellar biosynthetic protein FliR [Brevinema sp.]